MSVAAMVTLDELRALFAGDWIHDDQTWDTTPCYSAQLAFEIAKRCDCQTEYQLRHRIYGVAVPTDQVPTAAQDAMRSGVEKYKQWRNSQQARRGL